MSRQPEAGLVSVPAKTAFLGCRRWLREAESLQVIHVFERAVNLVDGHGRLVSLVHPDLDPGPFHIIPQTWPFENQTLTVETAAGVNQTGLRIDRWLVECSAARPWDGRPPWSRIRLSLQGEKRSNFLNFLDGLEIQAAIPIPALPRQWTHETAAAFSAAIAGLGPGLTPAGDDFLMGLIHGLWLTQPGRPASQVASWLTDAAVSRTTTLSAAWLRSAASGEAGAPWHALLAALEAESRPDLASAAEKILLSGHTSGADALAGFIAALNREE